MAYEAPSTAQEISLIYNTVNDLNDLAHDSYNQARRDLSKLATTITALPLSLVATDITAEASISWPHEVTIPPTPSEPNYTADMPAVPDVTEITIPGSVILDSQPGWSVDLSQRPYTLGEAELSPVPTLEPLPLITAAAPIMDVGLLESDFLFAEPIYVERLSSEVEGHIKRVLGGDLGIPASYWDSLWQQAAGDLGRLQTARLLQAGSPAASYWALPGETTLAARRAILDEGARALQITRLQQAQQAATFARDDFWQAMSAAVAYENQWLAAHQQAAGRALSAAEQLSSMRAQVHNANLARFNGMLEAARLDGSLADLKVQRVLKGYAERLSAITAEIAQDQQQVVRFGERWKGYQIDATTRITSAAEQVRRWNSNADTHAKYQALGQTRDGARWGGFTAQLGRIDTLSKATAQLLQARTGARSFDMASQVQAAGIDATRNTTELDRIRLIQAAQEISAKLDIMQAQWIGGQSISMQERIAELSSQTTQASVAASDVSYGRSVNNTFGESWSASRNEVRKW